MGQKIIRTVRQEYLNKKRYIKLELLNLLEPQLLSNKEKIQVYIDKKYSHKLIKSVLSDLGYVSKTKKPEGTFWIEKK